MDNRVGQNEAMHPHGVSVASGPLWCVPVAAGIVAVWHNLSPELEIIGLVGGAGLQTPLERHRIFSPQFSTNFYTISGHGLQDGQHLRVILRGGDGADVEQTLELRLAHWQVEGTPQIVSFIISRILSKRAVSSDHETLERFLSLASSWRSSARLKALIGKHSLYEFDVAARHFAQRQTCFVLRQGRLTREVVDSFGDNDSSIFRISQGCPERAYADLNGDLVELAFADATVATQDTVEWLKGLSPSAKSSLLDCLSAASEAEPIALPAYVTASLKTAIFPLSEPSSEAAIEGCFEASGSLFVFLRVAGTASLDDVRLELFGGAGSAHLRTNLLTCSVDSAEALPATRIVVKARLDGRQASACKVTLEIEGRSIQHWIHVQQGGTAESLGFVRRFWPLAERDDHYLTEVGVPFAQAWARRPVKELARIVRLAARQGASSTVDLQIFAGTRIELLHDTLIGLKASVHRGQALRITLSSSQDIEAKCAKAIEWAERYGIGGELQVLPANAPDSAAAGLRLRPSAETAVAIRAGFIPPGAGWLDEIVEQIAQRPDTFLVGLAPSRIPFGVALDRLDQETLLHLLAHDAIVAIAAPAGMMGRIVVDEAVCHTLAGSWIERIIEGLRQGVKVMPHAALNFLEVDGFRDHDRFGIEVDGVSLSREIGATEHRDMPISQTNVLSV